MKTCKKGLHQYNKKFRECLECKKQYFKQRYDENHEKEIERTKKQKV